MSYHKIYLLAEQYVHLYGKITLAQNRMNIKSSPVRKKRFGIFVWATDRLQQ